MVNDFDPKTIRKHLDAMRAKYGAESPVGHRCSNLIEQLKNHQGATGEQREFLEKKIAKSVADLARLTKAGARYAEDH